VKKTILAIILMFGAASCIFADYGTSINLGNMAYDNWDLKEALRYYQAAFAEKPNAILEARINDVKAKLGRISANAKDFEQRKGENPWKWVLISADVLGAAGGVYTYIDYNNASKKYRDLRDLVSSGHDTYYDEMISSEISLVGKTALTITVITVTGALVLYTFADVFFLHMLFPENVDTTYIPGKNELKLTYNFAF
jgi:hypothetical protein